MMPLRIRFPYRERDLRPRVFVEFLLWFGIEGAGDANGGVVAVYADTLVERPCQERLFEIGGDSRRCKQLGVGNGYVQAVERGVKGLEVLLGLAQVFLEARSGIDPFAIIDLSNRPVFVEGQVDVSPPQL